MLCFYSFNYFPCVHEHMKIEKRRSVKATFQLSKKFNVCNHLKVGLSSDQILFLANKFRCRYTVLGLGSFENLFSI